MAEATQPVGPRWPDPAALLDLIDDLRAAGYHLDLTHYLAAQDLLLALAARGETLDPPQRLQGLLGPLLCSSPAEQAEFPHHFARWAAHLPQAIEPTPQPTVPTSNLEEELVAIDRQARWGRWILIGIYILLLSSLLPASHPPGARIRPIPTPVTTTANAPFDPIAPTVAPAAPIVSTATPSVLIQPPPEQSSPVPSTPTLFEQMGHWLWRWQTLALVMLLLTPWLVWRLWWFYRAHLFLVRHATTQTPELEKVVVHGNTTTLFSPLALFRLAQELRRRVEIPSRELDIEAALSATIQQAGWFTPVYGRRRLVPEYLILIDRAHYHDHQARLVEELVQRLQTYEVLITRYAFNGDPRICFPVAGKGAPLTLRDLAAKHPDQRLILFADVHALFSPFTGELEPWVTQLLPWPERVLLTPEVVANWGYREQELAQQFSVLPATPAGLAQLVQSLMRPRTYTDSDNIAQARLPETLRTRPLRWLERQSPEPAQVETLLADLRSYLDETGFTWLCACAVYPAIDWNLTLYLGQVLQTDEGASYLEANRLLTLTRLPWLRYGYMPDWLRSGLLKSLPRLQENAIRFALQTLLVTAIQGATVGFPLEIARRHRHNLSRLAQPLLSILVRKADQSSSVQDYVFLNFMIGRNQRLLAIHLPEQLFALIFHRTDAFIKLSSIKLASTFNRISHLGRKWIAPFVNRYPTGSPNSSLVLYIAITIFLTGLLFSVNLLLLILIFIGSLFLLIATLDNISIRRSQRLASKANAGNIKFNRPIIRATTPATLGTPQLDLPLLPIPILLHNRYYLRYRLGAGGMGEVYLAEDRNLANKLVAVKQNTDNHPETQAQFNREAVLLANLNHPALPAVTDHFIEADGRQYLVMEYIAGQDLREILQQHGAPLPEATVLPWITAVMDALAYLHNLPEPIIHHDIKLANIKLGVDGRIYLVDFGLAKLVEENITQDGTDAITPGYSPIEQYDGDTTIQSDIYALGATLYVLLTNRIPPEAVTLLSGTPLQPPRQLNPAITPHTEQVILRAMALRPQERFQTIAEMRRTLFAKASPVSLPQPVSEPPNITTTYTPMKYPTQRQHSRIVWFLVGLGVVLSLVIATYPNDITLTEAARWWEQPRPVIVSSTLVTLTATARATPSLTPLFTPLIPVSSAALTATLSAASPRPCPIDMAVIASGGEPFCLATAEVTNAEYRLCYQRGICTITDEQKADMPGYNGSATYYDDADYNDYPVVNITVAQAQRYCQNYGAFLGRPLRLPTFDEWLVAYEQSGTQAAGASWLLPVRDEQLSTTNARVYGLVDNVKEWAVLDENAAGTISLAIAAGGSYANPTFPHNVNELSNYVRVSNGGIDEKSDYDTGFRCASDALSISTPVPASSVSTLALLTTPTPVSGSAPFVLFSGDPRSNNPPFCRGFQSQCNFDGCDAFVKLIEGPGCLQGEDARIVPGLYEVTLEGSGLVIAGRMTAADPLFPVPADGYNVTLSGSYPLCWRGWQSSSEPFGIMAVTQTQLPNRVDLVTIRYVGATCP